MSKWAAELLGPAPEAERALELRALDPSATVGALSSAGFGVRGISYEGVQRDGLDLTDAFAELMGVPRHVLASEQKYAGTRLEVNRRPDGYARHSQMLSAWLYHLPQQLKCQPPAQQRRAPRTLPSVRELDALLVDAPYTCTDLAPLNDAFLRRDAALMRGPFGRRLVHAAPANASEGAAPHTAQYCEIDLERYAADAARRGAVLASLRAHGYECVGALA